MNNVIAVPRVGTNQHKRKYKYTNKSKAWFAASLISVIVFATIVMVVNNFFQYHQLIFQKVMSVQFHTPVYVAAREVPMPIIVEKSVTTPLTPTQQYICDTFGADCKMALAVAKAENGTWQCDRYGVNKNGTLDWGLFQINTVHLNNVDLKSLLDCKANVDYAYKLFKAQGWGPWVAYQNRSYLKFMY